MDSILHNSLKTIQHPGKDTKTTTPLMMINSGEYTEETLMNNIIELITEGNSYRDICKILNIKLTSLSDWLASTPERIARTKMANTIKADYHATMQLEVLRDCPVDKIEILKAKEISAAHRWMARVSNPSKYGEKLDVTSEGQQIVQLSLGSGIKPPEAIEEASYIDITSDSNDTDTGEL